jgi:hypothetical protein
MLVHVAKFIYEESAQTIEPTLLVQEIILGDALVASA